MFITNFTMKKYILINLSSNSSFLSDIAQEIKESLARLRSSRKNFSKIQFNCNYYFSSPLNLKAVEKVVFSVFSKMLF